MDTIQYLQETVMREKSARDLGRALSAQDGPEAIRHAAASELARRGNALLDADGQSAIRALIVTLKDPDEDLAHRAADALADLGAAVENELFEIERHPIHDPYGLAVELLELMGWECLPKFRKCPSGKKMWQTLREFDWHYRGFALTSPSTFSGAVFKIGDRVYAVEWVASLATGLPAHLLATSGDNLLTWLTEHPDYPPIETFDQAH
jgi:hypothetical protein